ncbi:MMPL family protein [Rubripirellula obstinata]|uniref:MMPL family protein n=1 Tax=Rubripirellula obstinata TaxID=406547 RepID=A0A5B1CRB9_9BACT|nr:MMPL family transporter [Rubripirellula obstinata]KAA1262409.1 MMPL family protein [Rubripirellula obstinata]
MSESKASESKPPDSKSTADFYLRRLKLGVVLLVLLALPAIFHSKAAIETLYNRPSDWVPDSLPEKIQFNDFTEHFSVADLIMVAWQESDLDSPSLQQASQILAPLCQPRRHQDEPVTLDSLQFDLLPDWSADWVRQIRQLCGNDHPLHFARGGDETLLRMTSTPASIPRSIAIRRLQGILIGADGEQTCLVISLTDSGLKQRRELIPAIRQMVGRLVDRPWNQIAVVGGPYDGAVVDSESVRTIRTFSPPSAIIAAILCLICLRSVPLTASIVTIAVIGQGLVLAAVYYTGSPMNAVLIVLPPLVFVLTISAGIHLSNYYLDITSAFPSISRGEAAAGAMKAGVAPCCLATGTTVIGLLSLTLVRIEPVKIFGAVASAGVVITLALLILILPGAMVLTKPRRGRALNDSANENSNEHANGGTNDNESERGFWQNWIRRRLSRPWPVIGLFLAMAATLSFGLSRLESSVNVPRMFLPESDIRTQYAWFEQHIGPTVSGELLLTFAPLGEDDDPLDRLAVVAKAQRTATKLPEVGGALSAITFVPPIPRGRAIRSTIARNVVKKLIRDPDSSLRSLGFIADTDDRQMWRISIRMRRNENIDMGDQIATVKETVESALVDSPIPVEVTLTGSISIVQKAQEVLLRDLFRSFVAAFALISVVMMLMLRSVIGGLIAMLPNLFPTVALFGLMGLIRLPLDIGSVMSASVALGIAVDDTVHLLSRFGSRRARGFGQIRAAYGALSQCGLAMFQTTVVCGLALMAYWFSDFVPTSRFSLFMFGLLATALLGVTFLLPALMCSVLGKWLAHSIGSDPSASVYADEPIAQTPSDVRRLP